MITTKNKTTIGGLVVIVKDLDPQWTVEVSIPSEIPWGEDGAMFALRSALRGAAVNLRRVGYVDGTAYWARAVEISDATVGDGPCYVAGNLRPHT